MFFYLYYIHAHVWISFEENNISIECTIFCNWIQQVKAHETPLKL